MAERDYSGELPVTPPDGLVDWLYGQGVFDTGYLIYTAERQKKGRVKLICSECGGTTTAEYAKDDLRVNRGQPYYGFVHPVEGGKVNDGDSALCPMCEAPVTVKWCSNISSSGNKGWRAWPMTVTRLEDKLVLTGWYVEKLLFKDGGTEIGVHPHEAYVAEKKRIARLTAYSSYMGGVVYHHDKWRQVKRYNDTWGRTKLFYPWDKRLLDGSAAENCKLDVFIAGARENPVFPISYIRLWQKHPNAENLVMQGGVRMLNAAISYERDLNQSYYSSTPPLIAALKLIDWKKNRPHEMMRMTRPEYAALIREKDVEISTLQFRMEEIAAGRALSVDDMRLIEFLGVTHCVELRNQNKEYLNVARYMAKQKVRDKRSDLLMLRDYWRIAGEVGEPLDTPGRELPHDLVKAHDRVEKIRKDREDARKQAEREARRPRFLETYERLLTFSWARDGLTIRPARDEDDLRDEGRALHHCVGSYGDMHLSGFPLFFIRRAETPDKPYYTLQLDETRLTVRQNRGKQNHDRTKEVQAFEAAWIVWLRAGAKNANNNGGI